MLLTLLAELIVNQLNDKRNLWVPPNTVVTAKPTLDWVGSALQEGVKVLVVPELIQYNINDTNTRERVKQLERTKFISVLVGVTFKGTLAAGHVASWEESKIICDLREKIEDLIITTDYSPQKIALVEVESQPIDEQELDRRMFNAVTSFGFEEMECGLQQELPSTLASSQIDTNEQEIRVSMRRQALLERRLGRK